MKIFDSFAWFEYFAGSARGKKADDILRSKETLATPASCVAEIKRKRIREKMDWRSEISFIKTQSAVLPLTEQIALRAGEISELHFADALVYATALEHNATLVTGDAHFKNLPNVEMI